MAEKNINIGNSLTKFNFTDENGEVVGYFRMNPADIRVADRAKEVAEWFKRNESKFTGKNLLENLEEYDKELTKKIDYLLGYNASDTLFRPMSATAVMEDGRFFAAVVMDAIAQNLGAELKRRFEKFQKVSKYTAKYE